MTLECNQGISSVTDAKFSLSTALQPVALAKQYQRDRRIHIEGILKPTSANTLLEAVTNFNDWNLHLNQGKKHFDIFPEQRRAMAPEQLQALRTAAYAGAQEGFQYFFESYPIYDAYHAGACAAPFNRLFEFINSESFLSCMRTVTGHEDIGFADAQLTKFSPGDFLTVHNDDIEGKDRRAAFVLNLTADWKPDWGGHLSFFGENGHVEQGFVPRFNALNIFSVPQAHAVSQVASFSARARYGVTGWLRAGRDPRT